MFKQDNKKYLILTILGALVVIILVILIAVDQRQKMIARTNAPLAPVVIPSQQRVLQSDETAVSKSVTPMATVTAQVLDKSRALAPGSSLVTANNIVITRQGTPVKLNTTPASADAPKESAPINLQDVKDDANTVKMSVSAAGFVPSTFTVKSGQLVKFVLTSTDDYGHIWMPTDPALQATILGVVGHETREKSWNAPKPGSYPFICAVPGHAERGERGIMIVK